MTIINQRLNLLEEMINNLLYINQNLILLKKQIEDESKIIFNQVYGEKLAELIQAQTKFEENGNEIHTLNTDAILLINSWHEWSNSPSNKSRLLYPFHYISKKKDLKKIISNINQKIIERSIENRLIKEKISSWEVEVKRLAEVSIKKSDIYLDFCNLLEKKGSLSQEVTYLCSTIPDANNFKIDLNDSNEIAHMLSNLHASTNS